jgi:hypothetical protein
MFLQKGRTFGVHVREKPGLEPLKGYSPFQELVRPQE